MGVGDLPYDIVLDCMYTADFRKKSSMHANNVLVQDYTLWWLYTTKPFVSTATMAYEQFSSHSKCSSGIVLY